MQELLGRLFGNSSFFIDLSCELLLPKVAGLVIIKKQIIKTIQGDRVYG